MQTYFMDLREALRRSAELRGTALRMEESIEAQPDLDTDTVEKLQYIADEFRLYAVSVELEHDLDADVRSAFAAELHDMAEKFAEDTGESASQVEANVSRLRRQARAMRMSANVDLEAQELTDYFRERYGSRSDLEDATGIDFAALMSEGVADR